MASPAVNQGDPTPVTGGIPLPEHLFISPEINQPVPEDELGRQAFLLVQFHPHAVPARFQNVHIVTLNDAQKSELIAEMHAALGVLPFKSDNL